MQQLTNTSPFACQGDLTLQKSQFTASYYGLPVSISAFVLRDTQKNIFCVQIRFMLFDE